MGVQKAATAAAQTLRKVGLNPTPTRVAFVVEAVVADALGVISEHVPSEELEAQGLTDAQLVAKYGHLLPP